MKIVITATTDGNFVGRTFDSTDNPIVLASDISIRVERMIALPDGIRFVSSNYIIDAKEI
jgi:hypothetical protein